jgi:YVTN family beta-propeller protein
MKHIILGTLLLSLSFLTACSQQIPFDKRAEKIGLKFVTDVPLPGGTHRFDYQCIDTASRLLFIAHMGSDAIIVFDMDSGKVIKEIRGMSDVHGVLAVPELKHVYASVTGKDQVAVIDENSLQVIANIPVGDYPDGLAYAPLQKRVFVSDEHGRTVSVIDVVENKLLKKISIGGEVGNTHYDPVSGLIYSADQSNDQLVAIDPEKLDIVHRYDLPGCRGAHGFYIDPQTHYALITGEDNAAFVALDLSDGKIIARDKVGRDPDVLAFDREKHLLYVSSESGTVSVFKVEPGKLTKEGEVFFYPNAHSISVDQKTHNVFFPLQNVNGKPVLRIMRPQ